jgi:DNA-directed RNA polymerase specialized sigma24 family protein
VTTFGRSANYLNHTRCLPAAQAAWTRSWEKRDQLRQPNLVLTWTNSIALNIYRCMLRRESPSEPPSRLLALASSLVASREALSYDARASD